MRKILIERRKELWSLDVTVSTTAYDSLASTEFYYFLLLLYKIFCLFPLLPSANACINTSKLSFLKANNKYIYRVSRKFLPIAFVQIERNKLSRKILYYFAIFALVNKILITQRLPILILTNFLIKYYQLYRKTARDKKYLFSSHRTLRIFYQLHFFILQREKIRY